MGNYFESLNWNRMMNLHKGCDFDIQKYHEILCPKNDYPDFLDKYISLPVLHRLKGIGLLCGTDWTNLYNNRFYYSRLDHSVGVALIIWHFTHSKKQTLSGLFHDISTPVFSHVSDFRKGDALTQTVTEGPTARIIRSDRDLQKLLAEEGLASEDVEDYHKYPVADNEIPQLSADRLEYMFPSGAALDGSWTMEEIARCYGDIDILTSEQGLPELGFKTVEIAEEYCRHFCMIGHILQLNENKLTLQLLGEVMNKAVELNILNEENFMTLTEKEVMEKIDLFMNENLKMKFNGTKGTDPSVQTELFFKMYRTFRNMTEVLHTNAALDKNEYFSVSLKVKQRYINPLVKNGNCAVRLNSVSEFSDKLIKDFLEFEDTAFGCVHLQ